MVLAAAAVGAQAPPPPPAVVAGPSPLPITVAGSFSAGLPWQTLVGQASPFVRTYFGGVTEAEIGSLFVPWLAPTLRIDGGLMQGNAAGDSVVSLVSGSVAAGLALRVPLGGVMAIRLSGQGGIFYGDILSAASDLGGSAWQPRLDEPGSLGALVEGGAELNLAIVRHLDLFAGATYRWYVGLASTWNAGVGLRWFSEAAASSYHLRRDQGLFGGRRAAPPGPHLKLLDSRIDTVFPVLYRYYADHPLGTIKIQNISKNDLTDVQLKFQPSQHSSAPKLVAQITDIPRGESRDVDLSILFEDTVLGITEGTEIAAQIQASYVIDGFEASFEQDLSIPFYDRNSIQWDDDRKVATFVTAKDDEVLRFSRLVAGMVRQDPSRAVSTAFRNAVAAFEALNSHGMAYVIDPGSSYAELSGSSGAVDYVQFPRQTLQFRAGDCDDLSVTFNSMLEAIGVESAFITVPGHIYAAAKLELTASEARRVFANMGELVVTEDGSVWLPVEITALGRSFLEAWRLGAQQWREHNARGEARLYPTRAAWEVYPPVGFSVGRGAVEDVPLGDLRPRFRRSLDAATREQVGPQVAALQETLKSQPGDPKTLNRIGALYARYGLFEEARTTLEPLARANPPYPAAAVNLGNIALILRDTQTAETHYREALRLQPANTGALAGLLQASVANGKLEDARAYFAELQRLDPDAAVAYQSVVGTGGGGGRAADTELTNVRWDDDGGTP